MTDVVVRQLVAGDIDAVAAGIASRTQAQVRRRFEAQERGTGFTELIAWIDGEAVGFVGLGMYDDANPDEMMEARGYALVNDLHVEEAYRRRGAGRALMLALEERARASSVPGVILDTGTSDGFAPARALYRSLGYVNLGGVYLGGWSDPDRPGVHYLDELTTWLKRF